MTYTMLSKVGELLKDKKAVEILERYAPGLSKNPLIGLFKGKTLEALLAMPQAKQYGITKDMVENVLKEINGK